MHERKFRRYGIFSIYVNVLCEIVLTDEITGKSSDRLYNNHPLLIFIAFATSCFLSLCSSPFSRVLVMIYQETFGSSTLRRNNRRWFKVPETSWTFLWTLACAHQGETCLFDREAGYTRQFVIAPRSHNGSIIILTFLSVRTRGRDKDKGRI